MARKRFTDEQIAQIVVETMFGNVHDVADRYGISYRSIYRWIDKCEIDATLAKLVQEKKRTFHRRWADKAGAFIDQGFAFLQRAANTHNLTPEMIHAIAGAMKIASEIVTIREVLDARLSGQSGEISQED